MKYLVVFLLCLQSQLFAQVPEWQWGEFSRSKGPLIQILAEEGQDFKTIHATNQISGGQYLLTKFNGLTPIEGIKIKPVTPSGFGYYQQTILVGNNTYVFIADRAGKEMKLYVKKLDAEFNELEVTELISYNDPSPNPLPNFSIIQSPDRSYIGVFFNIAGKRNVADTYGYQVYNNSFELTSSGEYNLPFDANLSSVEDYFLTNDGELFVGVIELSNNENQTIKTRRIFKNLHVYQLSRAQIKDYTFELEGKRITNFIMNSNGKDNLTLFGIFSNSEWMDLQDGYFNAQIDLNADTVEAVGFIPFSKEIMLSEHRESEQLRIERKLERRNETPQLSRYEVRDIFTLADGSYVGSIEKYDVYTNVSYNSQTGQRTTYTYYYYNDIVAFCIDTNGQLLWEQRIPKRQYSVNDYGPYSSYASFLGKQSICFIFNDTELNYDANGQFLQSGHEVATFSLSKNRNVGALVQIDLKTGVQTRQIGHQRKDENTLLVPKAFTFDLKNKGLYTYGIFGPQEKFGYLQFK
jgi:hypothetical protein